MPRFRCNKCGPPPAGFEYEADDIVAACPRCGRWGGAAIAPLVDIHLKVPHPNGNVEGSDGLRWQIVCLPSREILAEARPSGTPPDTFAATDDVRAVSCPHCKASKEWLDRAATCYELRRAAAIEKLRRQSRPTSVLIAPPQPAEEV